LKELLQSMRGFWIGVFATLLLLCGSVVGLPLDAGADDEGGGEWGKLPEPLFHPSVRSTSASKGLPTMPPPLAFAAGGVGRTGAFRARGAHLKQAEGLLSRMAGTGAVIVVEAAGQGEGGKECEAAACAWEAKGQNSTLEERLGPRHFVRTEGSLQTAGSGEPPNVSCCHCPRDGDSRDPSPLCTSRTMVPSPRLLALHCISFSMGHAHPVFRTRLAARRHGRRSKTPKQSAARAERKKPESLRPLPSFPRQKT
jgi:hypothetical protein